MKNNIDVLLENQTLKNEFAIRNLDLSQVFFPIPDDMERENKCLTYLLDWVQKYLECGDRKKMEAAGYEFPPIDPDISPDNDWYIFERWMHGKPVRQKVIDQLPPDFVPKDPEQLNDEEILTETEYLVDLLDEIRIAVEFKEDCPARLVYLHLLEFLDKELELTIESFCCLDGCTGFCPGCFQRPWCEFGIRSCWSEDENAGEMFLFDPVKRYVSASPVSLQILQKCQTEEDREFEEFNKKQKAQNFPIDPLPFDSDENDDSPF